MEVSEYPVSVTIRELSIQGIILETHSGKMGRDPCSNHRLRGWVVGKGDEKANENDGKQKKREGYACQRGVRVKGKS